MQQLLPAFVGVPQTNRVYNCDALTLLRAMPAGSVDAVITDPPYGAKIADWDMDIPPQEILSECLRVSRGAVVWFGAAAPHLVKATMGYSPIPDRILIWNIPFTLSRTGSNGVYYRWHPIYCWRLSKQSDVQFDVISISTDGRNNWFHPATKPIKLMKKLVAAFGGESVLDPFCGSGTTAVAARELNKHYITCDISSEYCDIARERLAQPYTLPMFAQPA